MGQGLGSDAVNAIVDFGFGQLRLERVWLDTDDAQPARPGGLTKAGFVREGVFRRAFYQDGRWSDDVRMAMIRDEWLALTRPKSWELAAAEIEARGEPTSGREQALDDRADPLDPARVLGAARVEAVVRDERPVRGRLERDVEDVDEGDPALGRPGAP